MFSNLFPSAGSASVGAITIKGSVQKLGICGSAAWVGTWAPLNSLHKILVDLIVYLGHLLNGLCEHFGHAGETIVLSGLVGIQVERSSPTCLNSFGLIPLS